jgi:hypothetical protein
MAQIATANLTRIRPFFTTVRIMANTKEVKFAVAVETARCGDAPPTRLYKKEKP